MFRKKPLRNNSSTIVVSQYTVTNIFLSEPDCCVICGQPLTEGQVVTQSEKGVKGLQKACSSRNDDKYFFVGQTVHKSCRHSYCNVNLIKRDLKRKRDEGTEPATHSTVLRSKNSKFDIATDCLFCGLPAKDDRKKGNTSIY